MNLAHLRNVAAALAVLLTLAPAAAGNTDLLTDKNGAQSFPISPPNPSAGTPGALDNTALGVNTPAQVSTNYLQVDTGTKTATAVAGAATLNKMSGTITSESLTTAAGASYVLTLTDSDIAAGDIVLTTTQYGTSTTGTPDVTLVTPGAGQVVITVQNVAASAALNGTIKVSFVVFKN